MYIHAFVSCTTTEHVGTGPVAAALLRCARSSAYLRRWLLLRPPAGGVSCSEGGASAWWRGTGGTAPQPGCAALTVLRASTCTCTVCCATRRPSCAACCWQPYHTAGARQGGHV